MKTLLIMLLSLTLALGVSAQRKGNYHIYRPRIYAVPFSYGLGYGNPYFGYPYYRSPFYGYPYGAPYARRMPYKLALEIESINEDYQDRIKQVRKDSNLSRPRRRQEIRNLKSQRDREIIEAKRNFSRSSRTNSPYSPADNS